MKNMPAPSSSTNVENQPPLDPLRGLTTAKQPCASSAGGEEAGRTSGHPLKEVPAEEPVAPDDVPYSDAAAAPPGQQTKTGKKCSSGQMSFSSKILLCGGGSGQERESKRKEVDENNPLAQNPSDPSCSIRSRKSSRKGSKKKSKDTIPMSSLDPAKEEADPAADPAAVPESGEAKEGSIAGKTSQNSNKSCCFCWCCCCSCSCLSVKNGKGTKESNNKNELSSLEHFFRGNDDQLPSPEEIKSWGESFDKLMKCPWGRKVFREFLKCEYSEENILFWLACEDLKNETDDPQVIEAKCQAIYDDYVSVESSKEVSLDSQVREIINKNMLNPSKETFAEGQLQIYTLMHRDSYPRFVNSTHYKQILDVQADSQSRSAQSTG